MVFKHKFSFEEKIQVVTEYLNGNNVFREKIRNVQYCHDEKGYLDRERFKKLV